ncbi:MAG: transposase [Chitinispirillaceae bacterium]|nr:transposase [Chitinispirillaceae bacterium]
MPRKARIDHAGLTHHIMARTFNDMVLFKDDADRAYYLLCLTRRIKETGFICYAWVFMDTHVHLLIRTTGQPLWKVMKPLNGDYAHYYNKKYHRRGPLFSDRFKSIATQEQNYLERLIRYIHLNPIRAGVCKTMDQLDRYPWSGHRSIMENDGNGFQEIQQVVRRFGKRIDVARKRYREFIAAGVSEKGDDAILRMIRANNAGKRDRNTSGLWVIGDAAFQKAVIEKDAQIRLTVARHQREGLSLDDVLNEIARKTGLDAGLIKAISKRTPQALARKIFCYRARMLEYSTMEIGRFLGIQQAAVSNAARQGAALAKIRQITLQ